MAKLKFYQYAKCGTCKKAQKFLEQNKIIFDSIDIVERPPSLNEIKTMLKHLKDNKLTLAKLFNTSGELYRSMNLSTKLKDLTEAEALNLLAKNGKLIKRPFVLGDNLALVGYSEEEWKATFKV